MAQTVLPPSGRTARSTVEMPSQVSSEVGFFDRFAGRAAGLASRDDFEELRCAVGLESRESTTRNAKSPSTKANGHNA